MRNDERITWNKKILQSQSSYLIKTFVTDGSKVDQRLGWEKVSESIASTMLYNVRTSKHKSQADQLSSSQYFYLNLKGKVSYN